MAAAFVLADIVEQERDGQQVEAEQIARDEADMTLREGCPGGDQLDGAIDRAQEVLVDGELVIVVDARQVLDEAELGEDGGQETAFVHGAQRVSRVAAMTK